MWLQWLDLRNFRCHLSLTFEPDPGVNVLIGPNGAGKTSILEAIAYLSFLRSFRRTPDPALVRIGASEAILRGAFTGVSGERRVEIEVPHASRRRVLLNGKRPQRYSSLAGELPIVAFLPDDLVLVKGGPGRRREYLTDLAGQLSVTAGADWGDYERALRQRNSLLRDFGRSVDGAALESWDEKLAAAAGKVMVSRVDLIRRLGPHLRAGHHAVSRSGPSLDLVYRSAWAPGKEAMDGGDAETYSERLRSVLGERRLRDMDQRTTTAGLHRDEPTLLLGKRDARSQASQGEQRSVALALRIAAYRLLAERTQSSPLLLLDDVLSELDAERSAGVEALLPEGQVFVTSARDDAITVQGRRWEVKVGSVT